MAPYLHLSSYGLVPNLLTRGGKPLFLPHSATSTSLLHLSHYHLPAAAMLRPRSFPLGQASPKQPNRNPVWSTEPSHPASCQDPLGAHIVSTMEQSPRSWCGTQDPSKPEPSRPHLLLLPSTNIYLYGQVSRLFSHVVFHLTDPPLPHSPTEGF